eukprot:8044351-Pyramimonas_sp.AAC.1
MKKLLRAIWGGGQIEFSWSRPGRPGPPAFRVDDAALWGSPSSSGIEARVEPNGRLFLPHARLARAP